MMRHQTKIYVIVLFASGIFYSCSSDTGENGLNSNNSFNRTIKFDAINVFSISPEMDSAVAGATINIYDNYFDFIAEAYPAASRTTDSTGKCEINGLDQDYYYIRAKHPAFADATDSVSTPENTTSFVEMIFY